MLHIESLRKRHVTKQGVVDAVKAVDLDVPDGRFFTLLGPSGCGKTTILRCIAGLERPNEGKIQIGERTVLDVSQRIFVPAERRQVGMVFQSYGLWPHMNVLGNVGFPLKVRRMKKSQIEARVREVLDFVQLGEYIHRPVSQLSGGQQQRVALARALVTQADILLFDEPLSNLDAKIRVQVRAELKSMQSRLGITTLYVTHDQEEALAISDYLAVMQDGRIVEWGEPQSLYERPRYQFTASFLGVTNFITGQPLAQGNALGGKIGCALGEVVYNANGWEPAGCDEEVTVSIRPEDILLRRDSAAGAANEFEGVVKSVMFLGSFIDYEIKAGEKALLKVRSPKRDSFNVGETVKVILPQDACLRVMSKTTEETGAMNFAS